MLYERTTLASVARLIGESLEADYGIDPRPIFNKLQIDTGKFHEPGARVSFTKMSELWRNAVTITGDSFFGLKVGERATPSDFFVLGHAWLASATLLGALRRLCRYYKVLSTVQSRLDLHRHAQGYEFTESYADGSMMPQQAAKDAGFVALLKLCEIVARKSVRPLRVELTVPAEHKSKRYDELFRCPIVYGQEKEAWVFAAADLEEPLPGSIPDVASASDQIAEDYIASLDENAVSTAVRQLLVNMLPSGKVDQDTVAKRLFRSTSTLQRQLAAEKTNYREILESTRSDLAKHYLRNGRYTQAEIAFMVGYADQSNFARAFKRWTGVSPGEYQTAA
jgi:AraC-like DNA-binding protein